MSSHSYSTINIFRIPFNKFLLDYYWIFILLSFFAFLNWEAGSKAWVLVSFYPLFFIIGKLLKSFLTVKIVQTFRQLAQIGSFHEKDLHKFKESFQERLSGRIGIILGFIMGLWVIYFYLPELSSLSGIWLQNLFFITTMCVDVMVGYILGVVTWKIIVTSLEFRRLARNDMLRIRLYHPDKCAGLAPIGELFFSLSFILITIGLFLGIWLIYARWINPDFNGIFSQIAFWFLISLIGVSAVSIIAFFLPMLTIHKLLKEKAAQIQSRLVILAEKISELEESLLSEKSDLNEEELQNKYEKIQLLRKMYAQQHKVPTWPIDMQTRIKFFASQVALYIGIISSFEKLIKIVGGSS